MMMLVTTMIMMMIMMILMMTMMTTQQRKRFQRLLCLFQQVDWFSYIIFIVVIIIIIVVIVSITIIVFAIIIIIIVIAEQPAVQEVCRVCSSQSCSCWKAESSIKGKTTIIIIVLVIISPHHDENQGTVFIPTNEAFKLLPGDKMDKAISADLDRWLFGQYHCDPRNKNPVWWFIYFVDPRIPPHNWHQDSWSPLPGPKRAVWRHQDTSSSGWCWGQFEMLCGQRISSSIFVQCINNQQCSDV